MSCQGMMSQLHSLFFFQECKTVDKLFVESFDILSNKNCITSAPYTHNVLQTQTNV